MKKILILFFVFTFYQVVFNQKKSDGNFLGKRIKLGISGQSIISDSTNR